jgi:hypothetical protein
MKSTTKLIIVLSILVVLLGTAFVMAMIRYGAKQQALADQNALIKAELQHQKQITDGLVRAASVQVTEADLRRVVNEETAGIRQDLQDLDARVVSVSRVTGQLRATMAKWSGSGSAATDVGGVPVLRKEITWETPDGPVKLRWAWAEVKPLGNDLAALQGRLRLLLGPDSDKATAEIVNYLLKPDTALWQTGTYPLDFSATIVGAETGQDGTQTQFVQVWASDPQDPEKKVPLANIKADFNYVNNQKPEFRWWTPHIDGGLAANITPQGATGGGGLGFSVASYGKTKDDNEWRFIRLGAATDGRYGWLELDPVGYNAGKRLPLLSDFWIYGGPTVGPQGWGFGISLDSTF